MPDRWKFIRQVFAAGVRKADRELTTHSPPGFNCSASTKQVDRHATIDCKEEDY